MTLNDHERPLVAAGTLLAAGLGGFFDGILLHQILQTHNMLSGRLPKDTVARLEVQMFWDGMFHAATWLMTLSGVLLLFRATQRTRLELSTSTLLWSMAMGWGLFNLIEGAVDHHVLHLHHVVERLGLSAYDWAFLASGVVLIAGGWLGLARAHGSQPVART